MTPGRRLVLIGVTVEAAVNAAGAPADFDAPAMATLQIGFWAFAPIALFLILHDDWPTDRWLLGLLSLMATAAAAASAFKIHDRAVEWGFAGWQAWLPVVYINGLILYGMRREHVTQTVARLERAESPAGPVAPVGAEPAAAAVGAPLPVPSSPSKLAAGTAPAKQPVKKSGGKAACLQLLEVNPNLTDNQLAEQVECSPRTAARARAEFKALKVVA